jgi:SAM-dependent methyltransferase
MKSILSNKFLILKYGIEKYLVKNLGIFVPSSSGDYKVLGRETLKAAHKVFPLLKKLQEINHPKVQIKNAEQFCIERKSILNASILKKLFNKFKSDKSNTHNYHLIYSSLFKNKDKIKDILEIGIGTNNTDIISNMGSRGIPGASLRAFKAYFRYANIYGADFDKRILFKEKRIKTFYVDQTDIRTLHSMFFKVKKKFDLIIDDGLHALHANLNTVIASLDRLKKGGWLVIEDIPLIALDFWIIVHQILPKKYITCIIKSKLKIVFLIQKK